MELRGILAKNVFRRRTAARLSQEALAHRSGIDRTWLSKLETRRAGVSVDVIEKVAKGLGVPAAELLTEEPLPD